MDRKGVRDVADKKRTDAVVRVMKGVMAAALLTIAGIVILSGIVVMRGLEENTIRILNQVIKALSLLAGVWISVGRGGEKGLLTGAAVGILYILIGYAMVSLMDAAETNAKVMAIEEAAGALLGGAYGIAFANMKGAARTRAYR